MGRWWWLGLGAAWLMACGRITPTPTLPPEATRLESTATFTPSPTPTVTPSPTATPEPMAALVNGQPIFLADYEKEVARCEAGGVTDCAARVLSGLIEQAVMEQAAQADGLSVTDDEVTAALAASAPPDWAAWLSANLYTEAEYREAVRRELLRAKAAQAATARVGDTAEQVRAQMLVVADEATAQDLLAQIQSGADFAVLAVQYSLDLSSRAAGGDLGWFPRGLLTMPEVEEAAFALQPGEISGVIKSALGYHIIQTLERDPARPLSPTAAQALRAQAYQTWLTGLLAQANIQTFINP